MPIKPENRLRYPFDWRVISERIRFVRAGGRCECVGQCGGEHGGALDSARCSAMHLALVERKGKQIKIVLTVAHLDHMPENNDDGNLLAMCQRCHLRYDREEHARVRRATLRERKAAGVLL